MKTEVVKRIDVTFEKDERELIKKVGTLINDLRNKGAECGNSWYEINNACYDIIEIDNFADFIKNLAYTKVVEIS